MVFVCGRTSRSFRARTSFDGEAEITCPTCRKRVAEGASYLKADAKSNTLQLETTMDPFLENLAAIVREIHGESSGQVRTSVNVFVNLYEGKLSVRYSASTGPIAADTTGHGSTVEEAVKRLRDRMAGRTAEVIALEKAAKELGYSLQPGS
jgi:hypothetical protein